MISPLSSLRYFFYNNLSGEYDKDRPMQSFPAAWGDSIHYRKNDMADSSVSISNPVSIESDSKQRVAYDLMIKIDWADQSKVKDRSYWLTLYRQCYKATSGHALKSILQED
jgi:hypothetical protein